MWIWLQHESKSFRALFGNSLNKSLIYKNLRAALRFFCAFRFLKEEPHWVTSRSSSQATSHTLRRLPKLLVIEIRFFSEIFKEIFFYLDRIFYICNNQLKLEIMSPQNEELYLAIIQLKLANQAWLYTYQFN